MQVWYKRVAGYGVASCDSDRFSLEDAMSFFFDESVYNNYSAFPVSSLS